MTMSQVLSMQCCSWYCNHKTSSYEKANPAISPSTSESHQSMALFSGAVIQGGNFSININTVNQSPKFTLEQSSPPEALPSGRDWGLWWTVTMSKNIAMIWICCYLSLALKFPLFPLLKFWKESVEVFTLSRE